VGRPHRARLRAGSLRKPTSLVGSVFKKRHVFDLLRLLRMAETLPGKRPDETVMQWASPLFSASFIHDVLEPIAGLYFLQDLHTVSRDYLLKTLRYLSKIKLQSFKSGMGHLATQLATRLEVRNDFKVEHIEIEKNRISVQGAQLPHFPSGVIIATPLPETIRLLSRYLEAPAVSSASNWPYACVVVAHILMTSTLPRVALQVLPPFGNRQLACGLTIESVKHRLRTPHGMEILAMYARPDQADRLMQKSDEALQNLFIAELQQWLKIPSQQIATCVITRWKHAAAFCDPDVPQRIAVMQEGFANLLQIAPIWVAGDFFGISGLDGAVTSAEKAARNCLQYFHRNAP
jgi:protoporphyrinogen oxidase